VFVLKAVQALNALAAPCIDSSVRIKLGAIFASKQRNANDVMPCRRVLDGRGRHSKYSTGSMPCHFARIQWLRLYFAHILPGIDPAGIRVHPVMHKLLVCAPSRCAISFSWCIGMWSAAAMYMSNNVFLGAFIDCQPSTRCTTRKALPHGEATALHVRGVGSLPQREIRRGYASPHVLLQPALRLLVRPDPGAIARHAPGECCCTSYYTPSEIT